MAPHPGWPRARAGFAYIVLLAAASVVAVIGAVAVHEVVGHCGAAWVFGARVAGVEIGPFGGGTAHFDLPPGAGSLARAATSGGGMVVEAVAAILALVVARRVRRIELRLVLVAFAAYASLSTLGYVAYGLYFGVGDPAAVVEALGLAPVRTLMSGECNWWIPFAAPVPLVALALMRAAMRVQDALVPTRTLRGRLTIAAVSFGAVAAMNAGGTLALGGKAVPSAVAEMREHAEHAREDAARAERVISAARAVRAAHAGEPESVVVREVQARVAVVIAEPVPKSEIRASLPMHRLLLAGAALGALAGVVTLRPTRARRRARLGARATAVVVAMAIASLAAAACTGRPASTPARGIESAPGPNGRAQGPEDTSPESFELGGGSGDVVAPYVRLERSSRLSVPLPKGRAREIWSAPLEAKDDPAFLLAAGTRILVQGRSGGAGNGSAFVLFDRKGRRVAGGTYDGVGLRLVPAEGTFYAVGGASTWRLADGKRAPDELERDPPPENGIDAKRAPVHDRAIVFARGGVIRLRDDRGSRDVAEGGFEALDASIDDDGVLHVLVRQERDLALWSAPLGGGSLGRVRLGAHRRDRVTVPPVAGKTVRVIVLDDRIIAIGQDGKTLWERRGALTGGVTITSDDHVLAASDDKVLAIDPNGRVSALATAPREVLLTPPILASHGASSAPLLLVASGTALHAYVFE